MDRQNEESSKREEIIFRPSWQPVMKTPQPPSPSTPEEIERPREYSKQQDSLKQVTQKPFLDRPIAEGYWLYKSRIHIK